MSELSVLRVELGFREINLGVVQNSWNFGPRGREACKLQRSTASPELPDLLSDLVNRKFCFASY